MFNGSPPIAPTERKDSRTRHRGLEHQSRRTAGALAGYTVERLIHDYGVDLILSVFTDEGEPEVRLVYIQVKSTDHLKFVRGNRFVTCRIERAHLRAWLLELMPVILIVYDAAGDRAFWLYIQAAFTGLQRFRIVQGSETLTVRIPKEQVLDPEAIRLFRSFLQRIERQTKGVIHHE
jgi:hypothetical protein